MQNLRFGLSNHKKYNSDWDINVSPLHQCNWIKDKNDNIIVKNIYKFDNINSVTEKLFNVKPKQKNISSKNDYTLNRKTEDKIKEIFKEDIELYNNLLNTI